MPYILLVLLSSGLAGSFVLSKTSVWSLLFVPIPNDNLLRFVGLFIA